MHFYVSPIHNLELYIYLSEIIIKNKIEEINNNINET